MNHKKPILITGANRSGTTWVGRMVAAANNVVYIHEPFNIAANNPNVNKILSNKWYTYISQENEEDYLDSLKKTISLRYDPITTLRQYPTSPTYTELIEKILLRTLRHLYYRLAGKRVLIKDPIAIFSSEWLSETFNMDVVVMIRHPAAFAHSLITANWSHPFEHFLQQPLLMKDHLYSFEKEIKEYALHPKTLLEQACLLWRMIYTVIDKYRQHHPGWIYIRHEDISRNPLHHFQMLYDRLGLQFTSDVKKIILEHSTVNVNLNSVTSIKRDSKLNVGKWKSKLTKSEITYIREQVEDVSVKFYSGDDWVK